MSPQKPDPVAPNGTQATLESALDLHRRGDRQAAAILYRDLLSADPDHVDALHLLGVIALDTHDPRAAIKLISRSLEIHDDNAAAHANLGFALQAIHDFDAALISFDRAIALDVANAGAWVGRADVLAHRDRDALAIAGYERALMLDMHNDHAWRGYGLALHRLNRCQEALACFDRILIRNPDDIAILYARGNALTEMGRTDDAIASFDRVIALDPNHSRALHQRGALQLDRGFLADALASFDAALAIAPTLTEAWQNRGNALARLRRSQEALESFTEALRLRPDMHEALQNRGAVLTIIGDADRALEDFDRALSVRANDLPTHLKRGAVLLQLKRPDDATSAFDHMLSLDPDNIDARLGKAAVLKSLRAYDEALAAVDEVLELVPLNKEGMYERAHILLTADRYDASLERAIEAGLHHPKNAGILNVHALALQGKGQPEEALEIFERALTADPDHIDARFNASLLYLRRGDYASGWPGFEFRWLRAKANARRHHDVPEWSGLESLANKRLLIWADEGLGDTLQFSRYAPLIKARGGSVVLEVQPPLKELLTANFSDLTIVARGEAVPPCDFAIPLLSVPNALKLDSALIPHSVSYIEANLKLVECWRKRLTRISTGKRKIGIAISGNPAHGNDRKRSATLRDFAPLLAMGDVFIVQRGLNAIDEDYLLSEPRLHNIGAEIDGFDQAAGVLSNLDLIISVDTATAHLSAAMGKPTWLLLPSNCDWRWGLESDGTAWYPSMRLFRQEHAGDWVDPIRQMVERLQGDEL